MPRECAGTTTALEHSWVGEQPCVGELFSLGSWRARCSPRAPAHADGRAELGDAFRYIGRSADAFDAQLAILGWRDEDRSLWAPFQFTWGKTINGWTLGAVRVGTEFEMRFDRVHVGIGGAAIVLWGHALEVNGVDLGVGLDASFRIDLFHEKRLTGYGVARFDTSAAAYPYYRPGAVITLNDDERLQAGFTKAVALYGAGIGFGVEWTHGSRGSRRQPAAPDARRVLRSSCARA